MKTKTFLLALLIATAAAAQPIVGPEVWSPPMQGLTDYAFAPLRDGYLLAWAQHGHLYAGRLDSNLQLNAAPLDILLSSPAAEARSLVVATNGVSALLAWNEENPPSKLTYAATVRTDGPALLAGPLAVNGSTAALTAGVRNGKFVLATGNQLLVVNDRLGTESVTIIDPFLSAATADSGDVGAATLKASTSCGSGFFAVCSTRSTFTFSSQLYVRSFAYVMNSPASPLLRDPVVAADGDHFVGLIAEKNQTHVIEMVPTIPSGEWFLPALVNPQLIGMAGNGKDVLLVSANDVLKGQFLELYDTVSPPFVITSGNFAAPKAFATSSSEFVVTYTREVPGGVVLAGRKIQLQRNRQRGVR